MATILTGKTGSVYAVNDITAFTTEDTTEAPNYIYQIDDVLMRIWDPNVAITISTGAFDKSYYDNGVNWFEGKVKLLTTGEGGLQVSGSYITIQEIKVHGWALNTAVDQGDVSYIGSTWKETVSLMKSGSITLSRYRILGSNIFDNDDSGYQEVGLSGKTLTTETGLATTTSYSFKVNVDGAGVVDEVITTESDTTYAAILILMNATLAAAGTFGLSDGDLRCTSDSDGPSSTIALAAGVAETDLFATLTGWSDFNEAVAGSWNTKYFLIKLMQDDTHGFWAKASRTALGITKAINTVDQESTTFEISSAIKYF